MGAVSSNPLVKVLRKIEKNEGERNIENMVIAFFINSETKV